MHRDTTEPPAEDAVRGFVSDVFASLARRDRLATAGLYLRGLIEGEGRRSMQAMAQRLGVDHQRLQQFVTTSPWDVAPVRERLVRRVHERFDPEVWLIDDTSQVKDGAASVAVARQYSPEAGRIVNCQVSVGVHAVCGDAVLPLDRRLFLPSDWDPSFTRAAHTVSTVRERRRRCGVPDDERYRPRRQVAVEMLDGLVATGCAPRVVVAGAGYGESVGFRHALLDRGLPYVVAVDASTLVRAEPAATRTVPGREAATRRATSVTCRSLIVGTPDARTLVVDGTRVRAVRVSQTAIGVPLRRDPSEWLLAEWPAGTSEPAAYWLAAMPDDVPLDRVAQYARAGRLARERHRAVERALGLGDFEGRSWRGWHHHAVLVGAAAVLLAETTMPAPAGTGIARVTR